MRILGIRLWPEKLSDADYVERIRKYVRTWRRMRYFFGAMGLFLMVVAIYGLIVSTDTLKFFKTLEASEQRLVYLVFAVAIMWGVFLGFVYFIALFLILKALVGDRTEKLLLDCWDALHSNKDTPQ